MTLVPYLSNSPFTTFISSPTHQAFILETHQVILIVVSLNVKEGEQRPLLVLAKCLSRATDVGAVNEGVGHSIQAGLDMQCLLHLGSIACTTQWQSMVSQVVIPYEGVILICIYFIMRP